MAVQFRQPPHPLEFPRLRNMSIFERKASKVKGLTRDIEHLFLGRLLAPLNFGASSPIVEDDSAPIGTSMLAEQFAKEVF